MPSLPRQRRLRLQPRRRGGERRSKSTCRSRLQSASLELLCRAALEGAGIAALATALVAPHLASGALVHLLPEWISGRFTICAALPQPQADAGADTRRSSTF